MDRFRKILVSVDASVPGETPHSLLRAIRLAKDTGAGLRVVDVLNVVPSYVRQLFHGESTAEDVMVAQLEQNLKQMCQNKDAEGVKISTAVLRGRPFVELIREVESHGCDLLMRDVSGEEQTGHLFFGSLDMRLIRNCPCPVWLVKPRPVVVFERVLVAIDPLPADQKEARLNRRITDLAASLADWERGQLYVVSAWEIRGEPLLISKLSQAALREHVDGIATTGRKHLEDCLTTISKPPPEKNIRFQNGIAANVIKEYANEIDADLIVMGSLARVGIPGMLIGNTAERVLRQIRSSVLTIKPKTFLSPVLSDQSESNGDGYGVNRRSG